jgi:DNA-binding protein Fis
MLLEVISMEQKEKKYTRRVPINFKETQHDSLRDLAHNDRKSISHHVRRAVDDYLKKVNGEHTKE